MATVRAEARLAREGDAASRAALVGAGHVEAAFVAEAAAGAGLYRSYVEVLLRYAVKPFDRPDHPLFVSVET